jgi:hypothetical protein
MMLMKDTDCHEDWSSEHGRSARRVPELHKAKSLHRQRLDMMP